MGREEGELDLERTETFKFYKKIVFFVISKRKIE